MKSRSLQHAGVQDHSGVAVAIAARFAGCRHQSLDLGARQIYPRPSNWGIYDVWGGATEYLKSQDIRPFGVEWRMRMEARATNIMTRCYRSKNADGSLGISSHVRCLFTPPVAIERDLS
jgi:hypothetical protein